MNIIHYGTQEKANYKAIRLFSYYSENDEWIQKKVM